MEDSSLWYVDDGAPHRLFGTVVPSEGVLEDWVQAEPSLVAHGLEVVRRQLILGGVRLDLFCVEDPGTWVVIELKRHNASREALMQGVDYAARLSELTIEELEREVTRGESTMSPAGRELVARALDRERSGEGRDIRIVLAGLGTNEDLRRMVRYMETFQFPIRVCSFSAYTSPTGQGFILSRATEEDDESKGVESTSSTTSYDERMAVVLAHADSMGQREAMERVIAAFTSNDRVFVRPYKRGIMIAPVAAKNRYLAYIAPRTNGVSEIFAVDAIQEFFPGVDVEALRRVPAKLVLTTPDAAQSWASSISDAIAAVPIDG